uniref:Electron transfer flavoprotein subunit beta n=1 Tax=Corethron hystrix TaxID=216773 RepID=A0A7S1BKE7_9STRA
MNPFCEVALEEAVRLKESGAVNEVVAISIGPKKGCIETLRSALAVGADRAILVDVENVRTDSDVNPLAVAKILSKVCEEESPDLVLTGKQSIDGDFGCTGVMLAGIMGWPQATFAAKIEMEDKEGLTAERETDSGTETVRLKSLPAVVTCDLRLNEPRYATLPNIMKAKKKPMEVLSLSGLMGNEFVAGKLSGGLEVLEVFEPPPRKAGVFVENVDELVTKLKDEAGVIS